MAGARNWHLLMVVWVSMLAVSFLDFQPLIVGGFVDFFGYSEKSAGLAASANMLGMSLGLALVALRVHRWSLKKAIVPAMLLLSIGELTTAFGGVIPGLHAIRLATGFGEGVVMGCAAAAASGMVKPDRAFALMMFGMSLFGSAGLYLIPYLTESLGFPSMFVILALLALLTMPFLRWFPERASTQSAPINLHGTLFTVPVVLTLTALLLFYLANNAVWAYYDRIGVTLKIPPEHIGAALSAGSFTAMVGALFPAIFADRFGRALPMSFGIVLIIAGTVVLMAAKNTSEYTVSIIMFLGATGFAVPFFFGKLASHDSTGRLAVMGKLAVYCGLLLGPAVAAGLIAPGAYGPMLWSAIGTFILSGVLVLIALAPAHRWRARSDNATRSDPTEVSF